MLRFVWAMILHAIVGEEEVKPGQQMASITIIEGSTSGKVSREGKGKASKKASGV